MAIITYVDNLEDEWETWISCVCTNCQTTFNQDTENFDLDDEETIVTCPTCHHTASLTLKTNSL